MYALSQGVANSEETKGTEDCGSTDPRESYGSLHRAAAVDAVSFCEQSR